MQPLGAAAAPGAPDFALTPGHYYVDGILCELDTPEVAVTGFPGQSPGSADRRGVLDRGRRVLPEGAVCATLRRRSRGGGRRQTLLITDTSYNNLTLTVAPAIGGSATASESPACSAS